MKYSSIYLVIGAAVLSIGVVAVILFLGRKPDSELPSLLPLTGLNAVIWLGNAVRFIWGWKGNQARQNQAMAGGRVFTLAPKMTEVMGENQLWRRVPEHLRTDEKVRPHIAWELFSTSRQMGYVLCTPLYLAEAITGEVTRQWPGIEVKEAQRDET